MLNIQSLQLALTQGAGALSEPTAENLLRCINSGDYEAAARLANAAFQEGCSDVRCIIAMLLGSFNERGPESLPEIFSVVDLLLGDGWSALEPKSRQPAMTDGALTLLFRSLKTLIDFHESIRDQVWERWRKTIDDRLRPHCEEVAKELERATSRLGEQNRTAVALAALQTKIAAAFELAGPAESSAPCPAEPAPEPDAECVDGLESGEPSEPGTHDGVATCSAGDRSSLLPSCVEVSPELARLMEQLDAFAALVERGEVTRAAIVAHDVRKTIESFDPVRFLPSLFALHFQLLGAKIEEIAAVWAQEGTPQWHALTQHYRADLKGFVRG